MRTRLVLLAAVLGIAACVHHVSYDPDEGKKLQKIAVVVRFLGDAEGDIPERLRKGAEPAKVGARVAAAVSPFEASERLRSGLLEHLPDAPPWTAVVPGVQAESALGSMLTVDHPMTRPDFDELQKLQVDGVLYVELEKWGATARDDQPVFELRGSGRLFTLPGHDTLWQGAVDQSVPIPEGGLATEPLRTRFGDLCAQAGEAIALELGGTASTVSRTPAPETPDIEDRGHPPEKLQPVMPFDIPVPDGGARDAGSGAIDISGLPDGGVAMPR